MQTLYLPKLRRDQQAIVAHPAKRKTCAMGRRYGKTVMGGVIVANALRQHGKAAWVVPKYKNSRPLWRWISSTFKPLEAAKVVSISKADQVITTNLGGFFAIYSEENIDSMRGEWFHVVVNDEAAKFREESRYDVIEPCVADSDGEIIDISTPRGRNWFWREHQLGLAGDNDRKAFHAPTNANPMPSIQKAFERAKQVLTERSFQQEWLAMFLEDGGGVFRRIMAAATLQPQEQGEEGKRYIYGADWARYNDYTVFTVIDPLTKRMVYMDRFNQIDYSLQIARLRASTKRFPPMVIVAEENSMGGPIVERLQRDEGLPVQAFKTTNATKATIIEGLAVAFEQSEIEILNDPILTGELMAYDQERLPSGLIRYGAPEGQHDDCVMSLALAWYGATGTVTEEIENNYW
mgnify:CR=1 FL=1